MAKYKVYISDYDYEDNVAYEDGSVYYEGEPVATAEQYYEQADAIAEAGTETADEEWMPLAPVNPVRALSSEPIHTSDNKPSV